MENGKTVEPEYLIMVNPYFDETEPADEENAREYKTLLAINKYAYNDRLAIEMYTEMSGYSPWGNGEPWWEPWCDVTINLPFKKVTDENCAYLDTNNAPHIVDFLLENKLGKLTGKTARSGYWTYPEFRFDISACRKHAFEVEEP